MAINKFGSLIFKKKKNIITSSHPDSAFSEHFRMIQTNLRFMISNRDIKTYLITSPSKGEGKSTTSVNLAVSIAQQKKKVLLIDANLREPSLHSFFNCSNTNGLSDVLTGRLSLGEVIYHTDTWRLDLLPSGIVPSNPLELLSSKMMQDLLLKVAQLYDTILIDSNSVLEVSDTKLLANQCDSVILILKNNKSTFSKAIEAKKILEFAKAKIVGVVINQ
ncbi:CpsD/CapB family tyrosine-protein kinase [Neobacillus vireti]